MKTIHNFLGGISVTVLGGVLTAYALGWLSPDPAAIAADPEKCFTQYQKGRTPPEQKLLHIVMGRITNDAQDVMTGNLQEALNAGLNLSQTPIVLEFIDCPLALSTGSYEDRRARTNETAKHWLKELNADVVLTGRVVKGDRAALRIIALNEDNQGNYGLSLDDREIEIEAEFFDDLAPAMITKVALAATPAYNSGRYVGDILTPLERDLTALSENLPDGFGPNETAPFWHELGSIRAELGSYSAEPDMLLNAVTAFENTLLEITRERVPLNWAMTQNNLGNALQYLGERESGTETSNAPSPPLRMPYWNGPDNAYRCYGQQPKTISALLFQFWANGKAVPKPLTAPSPPMKMPSWNTSESSCRLIGQQPKTISALHFQLRVSGKAATKLSKAR